MVGFGEAIAHGAATIINAISIGKGAAFGVNSWTKARVQLTKISGLIEGKILSDPSEDVSLIREAVLLVLKHFSLEKKYGAIVETESNIPIARGLKSSSAASNALVLATLGALGKKLDDFTILNLGVTASFKAKTTITGAFDDACASYFGGVVVTDNIKRKVLKVSKITEDFLVLFYVPNIKAYTFKSSINRMKLISSQVDVAFKEALRGNYWTALTMNGILYSVVLGFDPQPIIVALEAGALASGLSGKGPAVVAVVKEELSKRVIEAWASYDGDIIKQKFNHEKARITRQE